MNDPREPTHSARHRSLYHTGWPDERTSCVECGSPFTEDDPESEDVADFCTNCAFVPEEEDDE